MVQSLRRAGSPGDASCGHAKVPLIGHFTHLALRLDAGYSLVHLECRHSSGLSVNKSYARKNSKDEAGHCQWLARDRTKVGVWSRFRQEKRVFSIKWDRRETTGLRIWVSEKVFGRRPKELQHERQLVRLKSF